MRLTTGFLIALLTVVAAQGQYVPPVPSGVAGRTRLGNNPIPVPGAEQRWIRAVSPNFTVISSASEARTREIAEMLETIADALRHVHPRFDARFTDTTVFVFAKRRDSQPYFELLMSQKRTAATGAFVAQPDGSAAIIVDAGRPLATDKTVKHELMHNILAASGAELPLWLEEGIAEYFSTTEIRGDHVIVGRAIVPHQMSLRSRGVLAMEDVMAAKAGSPISTHILFYPQVWGIVDWMMRASRGQFYAFVADVEDGVEQVEAFRARFSIEPATVARALRSIVLRPSASSALQIEKKPVEVKTGEIEPADALFELATFLGRMNRTRGDAEVYLRAALEMDARHARATAALGTIRAYQRRFDEAAVFFDDALKLDGADAVVKLSYASALLRNAIGPFAGAVDLEGDAPERFRRARELAMDALAKEPSPLAEAIVGTTYLVDDDASAGIAHLERARAARPARIDYALNLYALYLRSGRRDNADRLFAESFARSRNPQAAFAARAVFVREALRKANDLIKGERIAEAADVVRELAEVTPDPAAKTELHKQADELDRTANANRQIVEYNKAVIAFNQRENAEALQILDTLIATATDADVRNRAERLRTTVRKRLGNQ